jgi:2-C-methyl-D-erythritol 4-phosphate cytidylyltransferase
MEKYAIIVAGGSGSRMGSEIPKQFLVLDNYPILMHTILAFLSYNKNIKIILVLPGSSFQEWNVLCSKYHFEFTGTLVAGGNSRFQSVKNGLSTIKNDQSLVAIHDGVRPLVTSEIIHTSFELAEQKGSAIAATQPKESIRIEYGNGSKSMDRSKIRMIQTPQTFRTYLIKEAFEAFEDSSEFTDDASVAEKYGVEIHLFEGNYSNIKITTPEDMIFARAILSEKK